LKEKGDYIGQNIGPYIKERAEKMDAAIKKRIEEL
jgi:hypothetical protein